MKIGLNELEQFVPGVRASWRGPNDFVEYTRFGSLLRFRHDADIKISGNWPRPTLIWADRPSLSYGQIRSPGTLLISGIGPADVVESPGTIRYKLQLPMCLCNLQPRQIDLKRVFCMSCLVAAAGYASFKPALFPLLPLAMAKKGHRRENINWAANYFNIGIDELSARMIAINCNPDHCYSRNDWKLLFEASEAWYKNHAAEWLQTEPSEPLAIEPSKGRGAPKRATPEKVQKAFQLVKTMFEQGAKRAEIDKKLKKDVGISYRSAQGNFDEQQKAAISAARNAGNA